MPVMVCPACGAEYVASVAVCPDDGTLLVESEVDEMAAEIDEEIAEAIDREEAGLDDESGDHPAPGAQVAYELDEWDAAGRVLLDQLLTGEGIVHVWEAGTLVIRAEDEQRTDELVEQVEITTQPTLDPDKDQVVYELTDWPETKRDSLAESLDEVGIPFGLDENFDLVVHEEDEERVETILDQVDFNFSVDADEIAEGDDDEPDEGEDGLATQDTLSELFIASDRLMHDAKDKDGVLALVESAKVVARLKLPYGFAPGVWSDIVEQATALRLVLAGDAGESDAAAGEEDDAAEVDPEEDVDVVEEGDADVEEGADVEVVPDSDEAIRAAARELRDLLRQYV